jgi:hypothetical protein
MLFVLLGSRCNLDLLTQKDLVITKIHKEYSSDINMNGNHMFTQKLSIVHFKSKVLLYRVWVISFRLYRFSK